MTVWLVEVIGRDGRRDVRRVTASDSIDAVIRAGDARGWWGQLTRAPVKLRRGAKPRSTAQREATYQAALARRRQEAKREGNFGASDARMHNREHDLPSEITGHTNRTIWNLGDGARWVPKRKGAG